MNKKIIFKYFLPLIGGFIAVILLLWLYNYYLLDISLANLTFTLKNLVEQKDLKDIKKVADTLNDTFLREITKEDFDLALALKLEMSAQVLKEASQKDQEQTQRFIAKLDSASNIEFAAAIASGASRQTQAKDIMRFIQEAIKIKLNAEKKHPFIAKMDAIVASIFPGERKDNVSGLRNNIKMIERNLSAYKGEKLQEKYLEIAKLYLLAKDWQNAQIFINNSLDVDPQSQIALKAQFFLGILYKAKGDFKQASLVFKKTKEAFPKKIGLFSAYQEADCLYKAGEAKEAAALLEEIFNNNQSSEIGELSQFRAAYTYLYDLEDMAKAKEAFAKLAKQTSVTAIQPYIEHKMNPDIARHYCEKGFRLIEEGYKFSSLEKYKDSLGQFDLALNIIPNYGVAQIGKALAFCFLGEPDKALDMGRKAKKTSSRDAEVLANLGFIYYTLGMNDKAIAEFKEALKVKPNSDILNYNLGTLYALKRDYQKARRHFTSAITLNPVYAYAYNNLGYVLWAIGEYSEAKDKFQRAVALEPDYIDAHYNLGAVFCVLGNYEEARKEFGHVEESQPEFRETQRFLMQIKNKIGY